MKVESNKYIKDFWNYFKTERDMWRIKPRVILTIVLNQCQANYKNVSTMKGTG